MHVEIPCDPFVYVFVGAPEHSLMVLHYPNFNPNLQYMLVGLLESHIQVVLIKNTLEGF